MRWDERVHRLLGQVAPGRLNGYRLPVYLDRAEPYSDLPSATRHLMIELDTRIERLENTLARIEAEPSPGVQLIQALEIVAPLAGAPLIDVLARVLGMHIPARWEREQLDLARQLVRAVGRQQDRIDCSGRHHEVALWVDARLDRAVRQAAGIESSFPVDILWPP